MALAALLPCLPTRADVAAKVGVVTAVNPETRGRSQARDVRVMDLGSDVHFEDRIETNAAGQAQVFFLDQSSLSIGPDSEITIDKFVYDPERKSGHLAASLGQGLMRYVGGAISKQDDVTFTTPSATIGIRGGILLVDVASNGATRATFLFGEHMAVTAGGKTELVLRPGYSVTVSQAGQPPAAPVKVSGKELAAANHALERNSAAPGAAAKTAVENASAQKAQLAAQKARLAAQAQIEKAMQRKMKALDRALANITIANINKIENTAKVKQNLKRAAKKMKIRRR